MRLSSLSGLKGVASMMRSIAVVSAVLLASTALAQTPSYSPNWGDLTAPDFVKALEQAQHTCLLPVGAIEKHGPSGPLGTDVINSRYATLQAVKQEYALVFPEYFAGQIFEAKHQPGTISARLQLEKDWILYVVTGEAQGRNSPSIPPPSKPGVDGHAGESELSSVMASRPDLVHPERAGQESGADLKR